MVAKRAPKQVGTSHGANGQMWGKWTGESKPQKKWGQKNVKGKGGQVPGIKKSKQQILCKIRGAKTATVSVKGVVPWKLNAPTAGDTLEGLYLGDGGAFRGGETQFESRRTKADG